MATQSSILAWRIPRTEEPGRLQSMGAPRVGHDWGTNTFTFSHRGVPRVKLANVCKAPESAQQSAGPHFKLLLWFTSLLHLLKYLFCLSKFYLLLHLDKQKKTFQKGALLGSDSSLKERETWQFSLATNSVNGKNIMKLLLKKKKVNAISGHINRSRKYKPWKWKHLLLFKSLAYSISDSLIVLKCLGRIYTVLKYITSPHDYVHLYNHHPKQETECFFPLENFLSAPSSQFPPTPDKGKHCSITDY